MENKTVDLLVVGAAGSGLAAGVRAKQLGVENVLIIEKMKVLGGCTKYAGGIFSIESPVQKRWGVDLTADWAFTWLMEINSWDCNTKLVREWLQGTGKTIEWMESMGMTFDVLTPASSPQGYPVYHRATDDTGAVMTGTLIKEADHLGVEIMKETRATHLLQDDSGAIVGVKAVQGENGEEFEIHAKAVVLATGSISNNRELLKEFYPDKDFSNFYIITAEPLGTHNTGDGYLMAREVGAAKTPIQTLYIGPQNHPYNPRTAHLLKRPECLKLTTKGERYVDENVQNGDPKFGWRAGKAQNAIPEYLSYSLLDQNILDHIINDREVTSIFEVFRNAATDMEMRRQGVPEELIRRLKDDPMAWLELLPQDIKDEAKEGRVLVADTLEEVATYIGCDLETLQETIDVYNDSCRKKYDSEFLKDSKYLIPITGAPYYVVKGTAGIDTPSGGVRIDHHMRVVTEGKWDPIPGLYCVGVCAGGWLGKDSYAFPGSEMSFTFYSGYTAGAETAKYILGKK